MKIRNKLSIQFTIIVGAIMLIFCLLIYYVSLTQHRNEFYQDLYERATTTAYIYLEEDGFDSEIYAAIRERYIYNLPFEVPRVYDLHNKPKFIEPQNEVFYDTQMINYIRANHTFPESHRFKYSNIQSVGFFYPDNQGDFVVIVSAIDTAAERLLSNLAWILVLGYCFTLFLILFAGRFFALQALLPIQKIMNQVNNITASTLYIRLEQVKEDDEISELVSTFNKLLDRLEENFLIQKRFVANASHELRTPLTSIIGEIEVSFTKDRTVLDYKEILNSVYHDALTLHKLITGLLEIANVESEKMNLLLEPLRVDEIVLEASLQIEKIYPGSKVNINYLDQFMLTDEYMFPASKPLIHNAFLNVIENAVKFSPERALVEVFLSSTKTQILIKIKDFGIGIRKEEIERIFDPFYRSKEVIGYNGYGIGLSLTKRIISALNGEINIISTHGKGTVASIIFYKD
jgi:two-component system, OmpR family, sensor histidine kinase ArlS